MWSDDYDAILMEFEILQKGTRVFVPVCVTDPELGNKSGTIRFLADTGADRTMISFRDAVKAGIDFANLKESPDQLRGIGGIPRCQYELNNVVLLLYAVDGRQTAIPLGKISIIGPTDEEINDPAGRMYGMPSLLGTDVLKHLKLLYNAHARLESKD